VLEGEDLAEQARDWIAEVLVEHVDQFAPEGVSPDEWDVDGLFTAMRAVYPVSFGPDDLPGAEDPEPLSRGMLLDMFEDDAMEAYDRQEQALGLANVREWERYVLLQLVDVHWREHLYAMDYLREGIHLRALGQKDPLSEYRLEGHTMFDETMSLIRTDFVRYMFHIQPAEAPQEVAAPAASNVDYSYQDEPVQGFRALEAQGAEQAAAPEPEEDRAPVAVVEQRTVSDEERIGRNDPCWCGSGKKYKKCHGAGDAQGA
jgi:preprotein translocase subunit SecA